MLTKSKIALIPVVFVLLLNFEVFFLTPISLVGTVMNPFFSLLGFGFLLRYPRKFDKNFKKWVYGFLVLAFVSIFVAFSNLNQEILSGLIANLPFLELGSLVFAYYLIGRYHVKVSTIIKQLKYLAWGLFIVYLILFLLHIEFTFVSPFTGSKVDMEVAKLKKFLINFGAIMYLGSFFVRGDSKYLFFSLILFSANMFGDFQRFVFITYIVTLISGIFLLRKKSIYLKFLPYSLILVFFSLFVFAYSDYGSIVLEKFSAAFKIFEFDPNASSEGSVNIRVVQSTYALNEFAQHPVFGNGNVRANNMDDIVGNRYFYVSDIGLIGVLYVFGLSGMLFYFFQLKYGLKMRFFDENSMGLKLNMIFLLFFSVLTGLTILKPGMFFICILLYISNKKEYELQNVHNEK